MSSNLFVLIHEAVFIFGYATRKGRFESELDWLNFTMGLEVEREVLRLGRVNVLSVDIFELLYFDAYFI